MDQLLRLQEWLARLPRKATGIVVDSRRVQKGDLFAALPGHHVDGRAYIEKAIEGGAVGIIAEAAAGQTPDNKTVPLFAFAGLAAALGVIADQIYGQPSRRLPVIGVTGTNGKTSSTHWIMQAMNSVGRKTAVIGTLGCGFAEALTASNNTTPDAAQVHELFARFVNDQAQAVAMEVSSIGLMEARLNGVRFDTALFTNVSRDHLDYHLTMEAYIAAKEKLFAWPGLRHAVINIDDPLGQRLCKAAEATGARVWRYSQTQPAELRATAIECTATGLRFQVNTPAGEATITSSLIGLFNVANLLGVLGVLLAQEVPLADAVAALSTVSAPPGRLQRIGNNRTPTLIVDYAHTPDALLRVSQALRAGLRGRQRLLGVFGCGGDRDAGKRPQMGGIAEQMMDRVWITNDNPRSEEPEAIAAAILKGISESGRQKVRIELDRRAAIEAAVAEARVGDIVLIAGKGHETYQERQGVRVHFSDSEVATAALTLWDAQHGMQVSLAQIAQMCGGQLLGDDANVERVINDSRSVVAGDLFVALKGERFDGHDYVANVLQQNACALIDQQHAQKYQGRAVIAVDDTLAALGRLAQAWRQQLNTRIALVVGSNGKTTVKEMIAHLLRAHYGDAAVHATGGNWNNAIGLPLTLLQLRPRHQVAAIELGMNHRGETGELAAITQANLVVINNAQREHQEFMKDVATVAQEHADALASLPRDGCAVLNGDDPHLPVWQQRAQQYGVAVVTFATKNLPAHQHGIVGHIEANAEGSRLTATLVKTGRQESVTTQVPVFGEAMACNALAALLAVSELGVPLNVAAAALPSFQAVAGRLCRSVLENGMILIDDTYNANPDSVRAAIRVLAMQPGANRWLVLGDMGEVGDSGVAFHEEVGAFAKTMGIQRLYTTGALTTASVAAFGAGALHCASREELIKTLSKELTGQIPSAMLIKGSRFMGMEAVVLAIKADTSQLWFREKKEIQHVALAQ